MMQPTTKALAQMLAGNTKMSGQLVHARNVLAQANRMVEDRLADRLSPKAREQFFEQLAVLKLTIADAEEDGLAPEEEPEPRPHGADGRGSPARGGAALGHRRAGTAGAAGAVARRRATTTAPIRPMCRSGYTPVAFAIERRRGRGPDRGQWHRTAPRAPAAEAGAAARVRVGRLIGRPDLRARPRDPPCALAPAPVWTVALPARVRRTANCVLCAWTIALCFQASARGVGSTRTWDDATSLPSGPTRRKAKWSPKPARRRSGPRSTRSCC